jgi:hypothetical protein
LAIGLKGNEFIYPEVSLSGGRHRNSQQENSSMSVTIYHNPSCGTSRNTLAMIRQSGEEPESSNI